MKTIYRGTKDELIQHLRKLAGDELRLAAAQGITRGEGARHRGRADGLRLAAEVVTHWRPDPPARGGVQGCQHSAQSWYLVDGVMHCQDCDDEKKAKVEEG